MLNQVAIRSHFGQSAAQRRSHDSGHSALMPMMPPSEFVADTEQDDIAPGGPGTAALLGAGGDDDDHRSKRSPSSGRKGKKGDKEPRLFGRPHPSVRANTVLDS